MPPVDRWVGYRVGGTGAWSTAWVPTILFEPTETGAAEAVF